MSDATVKIDVGEVTKTDAVVVDALARLALALQRSDLHLQLQNIPYELSELAAFMGLDAVLGVEVQGHIE